MAITEVDLDFTYSYDTITELAGEGTETNPSTQNALDYDDEFASSLFDVEMDGQFATVPLLNGDASVVEIQLEAGFQTVTGGALNKQALEVSMEGSLIVQGSGHGKASVLEIQATGTMYAGKGMDGDASVVQISMDGSGFISNALNMDKEVIILSMSGLLIQNEDESGAPIIIPADDDTEYPNISGEEYIVVNLRTKSHATYRDGERTAVAKTASIDFGSQTEKAISDLYLHSRARGEMEVLMNTGEDKDRRYPLTHGDTTQASLKNKKLPLGKGLKGTNWSIAIVVPDESHLEIKGIELLVTDLKRH